MIGAGAIAVLFALAAPLPPLPPSLVATQTEEVGELTFEPVFFARGSAALGEGDTARLAALGRKIAGLPVYLLVEAHTDADGAADANLALSQRRAEACTAALAAKDGVPATQLLAVGHGESEARGASDTEKAGERRVTIRILKRKSEPPERALIADELRARGVPFVPWSPPPEVDAPTTTEAVAIARPELAMDFAALQLDVGSGGNGMRLAGGYGMLAVDAFTGNARGESLRYGGAGLQHVVAAGRFAAVAASLTAGIGERAEKTGGAGHARVTGLARHPKLPLGGAASLGVTFGAQGSRASFALGLAWVMDP